MRFGALIGPNYSVTTRDFGGELHTVDHGHEPERGEQFGRVRQLQTCSL